MLSDRKLIKVIQYLEGHWKTSVRKVMAEHPAVSQNDHSANQWNVQESG
jgi:hypothetical protein